MSPRYFFLLLFNVHFLSLISGQYGVVVEPILPDSESLSASPAAKKICYPMQGA